MSNEMSIEEKEKAYQTRNLTYVCVQGVVNDLQGKILTLIDASTSTDQRKAVKDLAKTIFYQAYQELQDIAEFPDGYKRVSVARPHPLSTNRDFRTPACPNGCDGVVTGCSSCPKPAENHLPKSN